MVSTETAGEGLISAVAAPEASLPNVAARSDLAWAIVQMRAGERIVINEATVPPRSSPSWRNVGVWTTGESSSALRAARVSGSSVRSTLLTVMPAAMSRFSATRQGAHVGVLYRVTMRSYLPG